MAKKERVAILEIHNCSDCPHVDINRHYTADSFEHENNWDCKSANKSIAKYVDWNRSESVKIPKWCPLLPKNKIKYGSTTRN